jgi:hypothetical protein
MLFNDADSTAYQRKRSEDSQVWQMDKVLKGSTLGLFQGFTLYSHGNIVELQENYSEVSL